VTICAQDKECLFGEIVNGEMKLNGAGEMVRKWLYELTRKLGDINLDEFIIMPNHIHIIIVINNVGADLCVCPSCGMGKQKPGAHIGAPLHRIVQWLKTMTTNEYISGVRDGRWPAFNVRLWQRNYYERVIRNGRELNETRQYIVDNPMKWHEDENYM